MKETVCYKNDISLFHEQKVASGNKTSAHQAVERSGRRYLCGFYCGTTLLQLLETQLALRKAPLHHSLPPLVIVHSSVVSEEETVLWLIQSDLTLLYESIKLMVSDQPLEDAHKAGTNWGIIGPIKLVQDLHNLVCTVQRHKTAKQTVDKS